MPTALGGTASSHSQFVLLRGLGLEGVPSQRCEGRSRDRMFKQVPREPAVQSFVPRLVAELLRNYTQCGATFPRFVEYLQKSSAENFPDLWVEYCDGEAVQFPISVVVGSALNHACRQSGDNRV